METFSALLSFVRVIHQSVDSLHKGQWREALVFLWSAPERTVAWANNRDVGDLRRHRALYDVTVMCILKDSGKIDP